RARGPHVSETRGVQPAHGGAFRRKVLASLLALAGVVGGACAQTKAQAPPDTATRAYLRGLAGDAASMDAFLTHKYPCGGWIEEAKACLPKTMWDRRIAEIQNTWRARITHDRASKQISELASPCWNVFRFGVKFEILETRTAENASLGSGTWSFVKVTYPTEA